MMLLLFVSTAHTRQMLRCRAMRRAPFAAGEAAYMQNIRAAVPRRTFD